MKITLNRINDDFLFECANENGQKILLNNVGEDKNNGVSPMEALLMSVAGCSGIDVVSILNKQKQQITKFSAEVEGKRVVEGEAKPFRNIMVKFYVDGDVNPEKARKAADLSFAKYCSVSKTLEPNVMVEYQIYVNGIKVD